MLRGQLQRLESVVRQVLRPARPPVVRRRLADALGPFVMDDALSL
jgi:hypothetical protein